MLSNSVSLGWDAREIRMLGEDTLTLSLTLQECRVSALVKLSVS